VGIIIGKTNFKQYAVENLSKLQQLSSPPKQDLIVFDEHIEKALARNKAEDIFKNI
jgi:adenosine/AMP kinase